MSSKSVSTFIITMPGKRVISRTTKFKRRISSFVVTSPSPVSIVRPPRTSTASIKRASWKHSRTTAALALPTRPRSCGKSTTFSGFANSKPIASAAALFPDPLGPQKSAVVPWRLRMAPSKPQAPNKTPRAFSISIMAFNSFFMDFSATVSFRPVFGTTRSSKSRIRSIPRICFLQPSVISDSLISGAFLSRPTAMSKEAITAFFIKPPVNSYWRPIPSQSIESSQGIAS
mmetsp:Transcript_33343/g.37922  ORF Transcript_33343/g.37922 Transcript_33343/m.37922 type:complete len:230 (-) Transcript_33343:2247-2936(-)